LPFPLIIDNFQLKIKENVMDELIKRITSDPEKCGGRPCIRGMRIRVSDILELYSAGLTSEQIIEEMPDLEQEDLKAALIYASRKLDHPIIAA
jgi:uncharacterized protein (DUF433 family)